MLFKYLNDPKNQPKIQKIIFHKILSLEAKLEQCFQRYSQIRDLQGLSSALKLHTTTMELILQDISETEVSSWCIGQADLQSQDTYTTTIARQTESLVELFVEHLCRQVRAKNFAVFLAHDQIDPAQNRQCYIINSHGYGILSPIIELDYQYLMPKVVLKLLTDLCTLDSQSFVQQNDFSIAYHYFQIEKIRSLKDEELSIELRKRIFIELQICLKSNQYVSRQTIRDVFFNAATVDGVYLSTYIQDHVSDLINDDTRETLLSLVRSSFWKLVDQETNIKDAGTQKEAKLVVQSKQNETDTFRSEQRDINRQIAEVKEKSNYQSNRKSTTDSSEKTAAEDKIKKNFAVHHLKQKSPIDSDSLTRPRGDGAEDVPDGYEAIEESRLAMQQLSSGTSNMYSISQESVSAEERRLKHHRVIHIQHPPSDKYLQSLTPVKPYATISKAIRDKLKDDNKHGFWLTKHIFSTKQNLNTRAVANLGYASEATPISGYKAKSLANSGTVEAMLVISMQNKPFVGTNKLLTPGDTESSPSIAISATAEVNQLTDVQQSQGIQSKHFKKSEKWNSGLQSAVTPKLRTDTPIENPIKSKSPIVGHRRKDQTSNMADQSLKVTQTNLRAVPNRDADVRHSSSGQQRHTAGITGILKALLPLKNRDSTARSNESLQTEKTNVKLKKQAFQSVIPKAVTTNVFRSLQKDYNYIKQEAKKQYESSDNPSTLDKTETD